MGLEPGQILFISDVVVELEAAAEAGMKTLLSIRPGNTPQPQRYISISTFDSI
jgi:enolase-phosphatase E1